MKTSMRPLLAALCGCGLTMVLTGCQSTVGGQILPSAYYLRDDVQYHPAGPEFLLSNQVDAIQQYNVDRGAFKSDFGTNGGGGPDGMGGGDGFGGYEN